MDEYEPITGELRGTCRESDVYHVESDTVDRTVIFDGDRFDDLCDDIDAVHAQLERDYKVACEVNERQDADYTRVKAERDSMAAALDAAQGEHAFAPESHYMLLPKDADGKPIHIGDEIYHRTFPHGKPCKVCGIGLDSFFYNDAAGFHWFFHAHEVSHQQLDSWERIVQDAIDGLCDEDELVARCKALAGES